jgi:glycosyltransferase involved in cell wall biosynthesis
MTPISAVIITFNEERNILRCIKSLQGIVEEIIVLDSFSTDRTQAICEDLAKELPIRFYQKKWIGYSQNKNYLNSLATHDYLFSIDADEAVDAELKNAIIREKTDGLRGTYAINRLTNYCGRWIKHSGWYPDIKTRIFANSNAKWSGEYVHETLEFKQNNEEKLLKGHLLHYSYYSFVEHRARADKYSALTAIKMNADGKKASFLKPYLSALIRFLSMYLFSAGFLDGKMGYKIAVISAQSNVFKYQELRKLNKLK